MKWLATNLFDFETEETLGQRVVFYTLEAFLVAFTIKFCWEWASYVQNVAGIAYPVGLARYIDLSFMLQNGIAFVNAALVTGLCLLGVTRKGPTWAYLAALVLAHVQYATRYSFGKIGHGSNLVGMGLLGLAVAVIVFQDEQLRRRFTMGFVYLFTGLAYTLAAVAKLIGTGPSWPSAKHLLMWMHERQVDVLASYGSFEWNPLQEIVLEHLTLGTVLLAFGLLVELCGVLVWWRKSRYLILPLLVGMHVGIALTMNIYFDAFVYELMIIGLPWAAGIDRLNALRKQVRAEDPHIRHLKLFSSGSNTRSKGDTTR